MISREARSASVCGSRVRVEFRVLGACGLASALQRMGEINRPIQPNDLTAVANALAFHLEQLADEFGIGPDQGSED